MLSQNLVKMTWVLLYEICQNALFLATKIVRFYSYLLTLNSYGNFVSHYFVYILVLHLNWRFSKQYTKWYSAYVVKLYF